MGICHELNEWNIHLFSIQSRRGHFVVHFGRIKTAHFASNTNRCALRFFLAQKMALWPKIKLDICHGECTFVMVIRAVFVSNEPMEMNLCECLIFIFRCSKNGLTSYAYNIFSNCFWINKVVIDNSVSVSRTGGKHICGFLTFVLYTILICPLEFILLLPLPQ